MKSTAVKWVGLTTGVLWCLACASNPKSTGNGSTTGQSATTGSGGNTTGVGGTSGTNGGTGVVNTSGNSPGSGTVVGSGAGSGTVAGSGAGTGSTSGASTGVVTGGSGVATSGVASGGAGSGTMAGTGSVGSSGAVVLPDGGVPWSTTCAAQTAMIVAKMTPMEKAAQMVMSDNGSAGDITANGYGAVLLAGGENPGGSTVATWAPAIDKVLAAVPAVGALPTVKIPLLYGFDAVHGNNGTQGTVVFPHNAGMASSRNAAFVRTVGQIEAQEITAAGINWMFGPFAGTTWDYRWGRVYESFSEDPTWAGEMLTALIQGLQGTGGLGSSTHLMTCSKHAAGDGQGGPPCGKPGCVVDRGNAAITDAQMEQYGLAQYAPAIAAGLGCVMVSDGSWNNNYMTTDAHLMLDLLKGTYGFKGFVITDYGSACGAIVQAAIAGVDMYMECGAGAITTLATATNPLFKTVQPGQTLSRFDDAVTRILNAKCQAGNSFTTTQTYTPDQTLITAAGGAAHRMVGEQAVAQSLVLMQNNVPTGGTAKVLPIAKTAKVFVSGSGANDIGRQCGGWTISWQGQGGNQLFPGGTSIQQAIMSATGGTLAGSATDADVNVVVLSEKPYAEFEGDSMTLDTLPATDFAALQTARAAGKPVVGIIVSGRPVLINAGTHATALSNADAWIVAWLPGTEGEGVADVLFGTYPPTGKLSHSWPASDAQANIMCGTTITPNGYAGKNCVAAGGYKPLWALGAGCTGYTCP